MEEKIKKAEELLGCKMSDPVDKIISCYNEKMNKYKDDNESRIIFSQKRKLTDAYELIIAEKKTANEPPKPEKRNDNKNDNPPTFDGETDKLTQNLKKPNAKVFFILAVIILMAIFLSEKYGS